jgi:hypothetical protein
VKIKNLDKLAPKHKRRFVLPPQFVAENGNGKPLVLVVVHAGDHNKRYRDAVLKLDAQGSGDASGEEWARARIPAMSKFVIVGWENAFDEHGKVETYTPAGVEKLLNDLMEPDKETGRPVAGDVVIRLIMYAADPNNFRESTELDDGAAERLGKE